MATGLEMDFYSSTCQHVEEMVERRHQRSLARCSASTSTTASLGAATASCYWTRRTSCTAKDATPNLTLRGFGSVQRIKDKLEKACLGTISCADILWRATPPWWAGAPPILSCSAADLCFHRSGIW
ncbi:peroxidase 1-like [Panicum virgatum]|uniref:peroxidase 1-like n=1 Tax=Panicum virgatum TaxID=38727 RepID=UPI0019D61911|nr:peroxidase 1-like [Panicum virgatum]